MQVLIIFWALNSNLFLVFPYHVRFWKYDASCDINIVETIKNLLISSVKVESLNCKKHDNASKDFAVTYKTILSLLSFDTFCIAMILAT